MNEISSASSDTSRQALIDFANYKLNYHNKPDSLIGKGTIFHGELLEGFDKVTLIDKDLSFRITWNTTVSKIFIKSEVFHNMFKTSSLNSKNQNFEFNENKIVFNYLGSHLEIK